MFARKNKLKVLFLGYIWPEITSSAAGMRQWNLIDTFVKGYPRSSNLLHQEVEITYSSSAKMNKFSQELSNHGIQVQNFQSNDSKFDHWIEEYQPDFVFFDRYIIEEQFGWRVFTSSPSTIRILDTQDLHFLRATRQSLLFNSPSSTSTNDLLDQIFFNRNIPYSKEDYLREISSIYRCDLSLILSSYEHSLLTSSIFNISSKLLHLSRFHYPLSPTPTPTPTTMNSFHSRNHFCMIGNFRHLPNSDGVKWLHSEIWPRIHKELPMAQLHIYGAYPPKEMMELTDPNKGFYVKGPVKDHLKMLQKYKLNLAPLRFGAGIKGKITDGWSCGTPVVTTPIGSEGMIGELETSLRTEELEGQWHRQEQRQEQGGQQWGQQWGGAISSSDPQDFANKAIELYLNEEKWNTAQLQGYYLLNTFHNEVINSTSLLQRLTSLQEGIEEHRQENLIGQLLNYNTSRSTKFFSLWIEEKNKNKNKS